MANMKVTYMNKASGHGNMSDKHTFVRCDKCDGKYVKEVNGVCPHCLGKGKATDVAAEAKFNAAVAKEVTRRENERISAEIEAENAEEEAAKREVEAAKREVDKPGPKSKK